LEILVNYIRVMDEEGQRKMLDVVDIIIRGFFSKIEIKEKDKAK